MTLPERVDDFWPVRFALDPPAPVRFVSAAGGQVVAVGGPAIKVAGLVILAGGDLHMLRPGSRRLRTARLPPDVEAIAIAAEPWSPYRVAIASPRTVDIFSGHKPHEPTVRLQFEGPQHRATHLAWGRVEGRSMLYMRQATGKVAQLRADDGAQATLTVPAVSAVAADADGVLAMIDLAPEPVPPGEPVNMGEALILPVGAKEFDSRWVDCGSADDRVQWNVYLTVHGSAVAYSEDPIDAPEYSGGVEVSWDQGDDEGYHTFKMPPGVMRGPIAFQNEGAMFAAYNLEGQANVLRHVRGEAGITRIARLGLGEDYSGTPAWITGLAWDEERRALWAASPELGLIELKEPARA